MKRLDIEQILVGDNYVYVLHDTGSGATAVIDPSEAEPVLDCLAQKEWRLSHILITHHHADHVGGNLALKEKYGCTIVGNGRDSANIPGLDMALSPENSFMFGGIPAMMIGTPGHTRNHVAFWLPESHMVFTGDTLFALGCGRLFEGTPAQAWESLTKLAALPEETMVYCGHEYTKSNAAFARTIEKGNEALEKRLAEIETQEALPGRFVPFSLALEKATSPFLRAAIPAVQKSVGMEGAPAFEVFAEIRRRKDVF